jgi:excisionase family DNA binding protein
MPHRPTDRTALPSLLKVDDVAAALAVSRRTVWRLIADRRLPVRRVGRSVRVSDTDLRAFLERSRGM